MTIQVKVNRSIVLKLINFIITSYNFLAANRPELTLLFEKFSDYFSKHLKIDKLRNGWVSKHLWNYPESHKIMDGKNSYIFTVSDFLLFLLHSNTRIWFPDISAYYFFEPPHDKTNKVACVPTEDSDQPGIRPVWSESSLSTWRKLGSLATHWAHSEDFDQTGRMPRLI